MLLPVAGFRWPSARRRLPNWMRSVTSAPFRHDLAGDLRAWLADRLVAGQDAARLRIDATVALRLPGGAPLFSVPDGLCRIFDRDLVAAGIARRDERGRNARKCLPSQRKRPAVIV